MSDPAVTVRDAVGRVRLHADSAIFSLSSGSLPDTRFSGGGAVTWPHDTTLYDFQVTSSHVNLDDLHWVSPDFPAMTGSGVVAGNRRPAPGPPTTSASCTSGTASSGSTARSSRSPTGGAGSASAT